MADSQLNLVDAAVARPSATRGDVPERLRRRYLTDEHNGPGLGFYVDASISTPAFRDQGNRLSTDRNDPNVVRDLVAIAQHRGWAIISVRGQTAFRRETWLTARSAGLEVRGYRPTKRDLQELARRTERTRNEPPGRSAEPRSSPDLTRPGASARLKIVEAVVCDRIVEPAVQARILTTARTRVAEWLERGARFDEPRHQRGPQKVR